MSNMMMADELKAMTMTKTQRHKDKDKDKDIDEDKDKTSHMSKRQLDTCITRLKRLLLLSDMQLQQYNAMHCGNSKPFFSTCLFAFS